MDMTKSIEPKSDQMNAEDLLSGPRTFTITDVREGTAEQPVFVYVAEHAQPFKPSKTVRRLMVLAWGVNSAALIGQRMTLFRDPEVRFGPDKPGGIRVSHMSGISKPLSIALTVRRGQRATYVVDPLPDLPAGRSSAPLDHLVDAFTVAGINGKAERLDYCRAVVERPRLASAADLTYDEIEMVIARLRSQVAAPPVGPPADPSDLDLEPSDEEIARSSEGQEQ